VTDLEKTSLKDAIQVFNATFMDDVWSNIKYVHLPSLSYYYILNSSVYLVPGFSSIFFF
jgi:hypothetical protein